MRILALADKADEMLWEHLDRRLLENVDLVISCGDLSAEYLMFLTCFTKAPILYVHGNHDERYDKKPPEGCECIEDMIYVHNGVRILGLGGSCRYRGGKCMYTEKEMARRIRRLWFQLWKHKGFDILVTHAPARGIGDEEHISHRGFEAFVRLMDKYQPRLMLHGHVHREYSPHFQRARLHGQTRVINAYKRVYVEL
ncbi:MAG: metallophosphoesterase family protein [Eubacteriales bacterium]|nr:metallophosphoesterase family protein [Eubacteriales bacterium]